MPRRYALPPIALPGSRRYQHGGVALAASIGDSEEFIGLRDYRPGDPLQRIHWKSYARSGEPVVREYQDEYFERHALILDTFAGGGQAAAFEDAVSIAASLACTVNTQECLLDLMFVGNQSYLYTAGRGQLSTGSLLEVLASVQLFPAQSFRTLHDAVLTRRHMLSGSICVLLAWDEPRREFIRVLRAQGVPVLVLVVTDEAVQERAPWLHVIAPGQVQQGLPGMKVHPLLLAAAIAFGAGNRQWASPWRWRRLVCLVLLEPALALTTRQVYRVADFCGALAMLLAGVFYIRRQSARAVLLFQWLR